MTPVIKSYVEIIFIKSNITSYNTYIVSVQTRRRVVTETSSKGYWQKYRVKSIALT